MDKRTVEDKAIEVASNFERRNNRSPQLVHKTGVGYDIESDGRKIEVKGRTGEDRFVQLNDENIRAFRKFPHDFWLYIVHFDKKTEECDQIIPLNKDQIDKRPKKFREQWEIPFKKKDSDQQA